MSAVVTCPICSQQVPERSINQHLDNECPQPGPSSASSSKLTKKDKPGKLPKTRPKSDIPLAPIFSRTAGSSSSQASPSSPSAPSPSRSKRPVQTCSTTVTVDFHPQSESDGRANKRKKTAASHLENARPLPERLRPQSLEDFIGQLHLTGPDSLLMRLLDSGESFGSIIFWGPPGCGKTTLARLLAKKSDSVFRELSATVVGINDVRQVFEEAKGLLSLTGRRTILFLDEVHRFNRAQQDHFLPYVEQGQIQLIGATTENPSFKINGALLSRCRVFALERLTDDNIHEIITRAVARVSPSADGAEKQKGTFGSPTLLLTSPSSELPESSPHGLSQASSSSVTDAATQSRPFPSYPQITQQVFNSIVSLSSGDARTALSLLSLALSSPQTTPTDTLLESLRKSVVANYDRTGDDHYDLISALHKCVRGSDGNAALYWLARMLRGGEDPLFIARRMVVCASEDIGLSDPQALPLAMATYQACQVIGMPECRINLAHLVVYLSEAPKSTRAYKAYNLAEEAATADMTLPVPLGIRSAPTRLMKELGYAEGYRYNPDYAHPVHNQYLPNPIKDKVFLLKEGDLSGKTWEEDALKVWERERNAGKGWEGRKPKKHGIVIEEETAWDSVDTFKDEDLQEMPL